MGRPKKQTAGAFFAAGEAEGPGRCRVCGCTEDAACVPSCSWADDTRTLCTTPECIEATADETRGAAALGAADEERVPEAA